MWYYYAGGAALAVVGAMKFGVDSMVRGKTTGAAPRKLSDTELNTVLQGRRYLIVGGTKGLGEAAAKSLAKHGAQVTVAGRAESKELSSLGVKHISADLSTINACEAFAKRIETEGDVKTLDTVVFTTGIISTPKRSVTADDIEADLAISYLSRFFISNRLLQNGLGAQRKARVFVMGFPGGEKGPGQFDDINWERTPYDAMKVHMNTVIGNEALVSNLTRRYSTQANFYGLNPGLIKTGIRSNFLGTGVASTVVESIIGSLFMSPQQYADRTLVQLFASPELDAKSGAHFNQWGEPIQGGDWVSQKENAEKVWQATEDLLSAKRK